MNWLPDKKYYEYAYHKFFNPTAEFSSWIPDNNWRYPDRDIIRFHHTIFDQLEYIKDHRVLDVATHLGYLTLFCLHNQATHVTATDVRLRELAIAKEICSLAGFKNFQMLNSDVYDLIEFRELCNKHDTILLSGIMYHLNHHYTFLHTIADSYIKNIAIETKFFEDQYNDQPCIQWMNELSVHSTNGFFLCNDELFVGWPNRL